MAGKSFDESFNIICHKNKFWKEVDQLQNLRFLNFFHSKFFNFLHFTNSRKQTFLTKNHKTSKNLKLVNFFSNFFIFATINVKKIAKKFWANSGYLKQKYGVEQKCCFLFFPNPDFKVENLGALVFKRFWFWQNCSFYIVNSSNLWQLWLKFIM